MRAVKKGHSGFAVLRAVLRRKRLDDQGGYPDVRDGKFTGFVSTSLPQVTPEELDALFALAGVVPDAIVPLGDCDDCVSGNAAGGDLGWAEPCCSCKRPKMTNFVPLAALTRRDLRITDRERRVLENVRCNRWPSLGLVTAKQFSAQWGRQVARAGRSVDALRSRGMWASSFGRKMLTRKGLASLKQRRST